jgi:predicted MFS family arabinose efflux permease
MDIVPPEVKMETAAAILLAASVMGLVDLLVHRTIPEPPPVKAPTAGSLAGILVPLRDRGFRPWLVFTGVWNFSQSLGGSLATLYLLDNIGFKNDLLGGMFSMTIVGLLGTFLAARRMGRMVDRFGIKRVLTVSHFFWTLVPAAWLFALPGRALFWVSLAGVLGSVFSTSATNASVKLATRFPASNEAGMYMAISTVVGSFANGLAALAAGLFLTVMGAWSVQVVGLVLSAFPVLFMVSFLARLATVLFLLPRVRTTAGASEADSPFLLPLFFEGVPGLSRLTRGRRPFDR